MSKSLFSTPTTKTLHGYSHEFMVEKTLSKLTNDLSSDIQILDSLLHKLLPRSTLFKLIKLLKESYVYKFEFDSKEMTTQLGLTSYFYLPEIYQSYIKSKGKTVIPDLDPEIKQMLDQIIKNSL